MKTIAIIAKPQKPEAVELARQMIQKYPTLTFLVEDHLGVALSLPVSKRDEIREKAELAVVLGGDGTLIHAAQVLGSNAAPIIGVNLGSLGFMTEIPVGDAFTTLDAVLTGKARIDSRMKLRCRVYRDDKLLLEDDVLNDVVINKSALARISDHETWLDGAFVATFKADGVIFSTPTGSTAYSLSAGGPIVHPSVDCVVITPICPHALTQRPIVVPTDQMLKVHLPNEVSDLFVTIDGQSGLLLKTGDRLEIEKSPHRVRLVRNPTLDYFAILRQKLHWGER